ncbi:ankyrin repeat domain-containing protein [Pseudoxanthomonas winnipegensis]|uniref:ankyrin repeat domain-containing protein n=1 Tax=Pseudoxanthomonas winnipegensis TaxID=2480810 RepID=UPI00103AE694|nr:ankyrin repeat domain-containing protein [Pseudoxanthomonas winnipegensis]TBV69747.1 ankyrin repeat domain-containing protein [Pseudoxanthomonas winnipegensis]
MAWNDDPRCAEDWALVNAARDGNAHVVQELLNEGKANPLWRNCEALFVAASAGHLECVKLLIPVSEAKVNDSAPLRWAAHNNHLDCVQVLIPVSDPKADHSLALQYAAQRQHIDVVKELLPHSDPVEAIRSCVEYGDPEAADLIRECVASHQKSQIHTELGTQSDIHPRKARRM